MVLPGLVIMSAKWFFKTHFIARMGSIVFHVSVPRVLLSCFCKLKMELKKIGTRTHKYNSYGKHQKGKPYPNAVFHVRVVWYFQWCPAVPVYSFLATQ